jgi:hypothetical protein
MSESVDSLGVGPHAGLYVRCVFNPKSARPPGSLITSPSAYKNYMDSSSEKDKESRVLREDVAYPTIDPEAERRLVRKIDLYLLP